MSKVILQGHIVVPAADIVAVLDELPNHIALTRAETGCLVFDVSRDKADPLRFNVYEEFDSPASFQLHQQRVKTSAWGAITLQVQRHYTVQGMEGQ